MMSPILFRTLFKLTNPIPRNPLWPNFNTKMTFQGLKMLTMALLLYLTPLMCLLDKRLNG